MAAKPPKDKSPKRKTIIQNNRIKPIKQVKPVKAPSPEPRKPPESYEKLLLFYLNKLKGLFSNTNHPQPGIRENSAIKLDKLHREHYLRCSEQRTLGPPSKYTSSNPPRPRESPTNLQSEVYRVVTAAIDYGFANNVLEKRGDCFTFKTQIVPGQRYCDRCQLKPVEPLNSQMRLHNIAQGRVEKSYRGEACSGRRFGPQGRYVRRAAPRYLTGKIGNFKYRTRK